MPTVYDVNVAGTQTKLSNIYDYNVAGTQTAIQKVYDVTSAGAQSLVYQRIPSSITLKDLVNWSEPNITGYYGVDGATFGASPSKAPEQIASSYSVGYRFYDYGAQGVGYATFYVTISAGKIYYLSATGSPGNGGALSIRTSNGHTANISSGTSVSTVIKPTTNGSYIRVGTVASNGTTASPWINSLDFVDITTLVGYVGESKAKSLCEANMRAKSGSRTIAI